MNPKVVMNKKTGQLGLAIPIQFVVESDDDRIFPGYTIGIRQSEPDGWILKVDEESLWFYTPSEYMNRLEILGEL